MNFVWFIIGLLIWGFLFWNFISVMLGAVSLPFINLFTFASENKEKLWAKVVSPIAIIFMFLFGTLFICVIYGGGIGLLALIFAGKAIYPMPYFIIAGICAFSIIAPSGETNTLGMVLSLLSYIVVVNIHKIASLMGTTIGYFISLIQMILWIAIPLIIVLWIILGILNLFKGKTKTKT